MKVDMISNKETDTESIGGVQNILYPPEVL